MLRTLSPVSSLHLSVFSTCILVRSSSFVSGFVRSPIRILLPDLYRRNKAAKADTFNAVHLQSLMNYISRDLILFLMAAGPPPLPSRRLLKVLLLSGRLAAGGIRKSLRSLCVTRFLFPSGFPPSPPSGRSLMIRWFPYIARLLRELRGGGGNTLFAGGWGEHGNSQGN